MSWWNPAWLSFPSLDLPLPSAIQRRFISFVLKRSLGHLLKPGQLDVQQIDSQIGSGYVQVRDLELDYDAVNALLTGLPIKLHDGSISSVTARIPWPNPLTANVGLSVQSLHLTFQVVPPEAEEPIDISSNLADSVVSVADSFMHHELTPGEEATLRESFHPDLAASVSSNRDYVPGGLDQFVTVDGELPADMDPAGVSIFATMIERLLSRFEFDAMDTVMTLVHPGHSSFTFRVTELRYGKDATPDASLQANTSEGAETRAIIISGAELTSCDLRPIESPPSHSRSVSHVESPVEAGFNALAHLRTDPYRQPSATPSSSTSHMASSVRHPREEFIDMPDRTQSPIDPFIHSSSPPSSPLPSPMQHSDSDMDEASQFLMSQSIVSLPPPAMQPHSPASTAASSMMFHSAISTAHEVFETDNGNQAPLERTPSPPTTIPTETETPSRRNDTIVTEKYDPVQMDLPHETILSLASEPIVIRITTSSHSVAPPSSSSSPPSPPFAPSPSPPNPTSQVDVSVTVGVIACAIRAWQLCGILDVVETLTPAKSTGPSPPMPRPKAASKSSALPSFSMLDQAKLDVQIRGLVLLMLPARNVPSLALPVGLDTFFVHPLVPPKLSSGYVRLLIDSLTATASASTTVSRTAPAKGSSHKQSTDRRPHASSVSSTTATNGTVYVSDLSICAFRTREPPTASSEYEVIPVLVTDPHLSSQYPVEHQVPSIPVDATCDFDPPDLPVFEVPDWTSPSHRASQARLSSWRVKPSQRRRHSHQHEMQGLPSSPSEASPRSEALHEAIEARPSSALVVKISLSSSSPTNGRGIGEKTASVEADFAPLHILIDLSVVNSTANNPVLAFLEEISSRNSNQGLANAPPSGPLPASDYDDDSEETEHDSDRAPTPPVSPSKRRVLRLREQVKEKERERQRLERLVLEDLNLSMDYLPPKQSISRQQPPAKTHPKHQRKRTSRPDEGPRFNVRFPMVRLQIRCPPSPGCSPRSGALVLDIHRIALSSHVPTKSDRPATRFAGIDDPPPAQKHVESGGTHIVSAEWRRLVVACSLASSDTATCLLSVGSPSNAALSPIGDQKSARISLRRTNPSPSHKDNTGQMSALIVAVDIPSVHVNLTKDVFDGLQLWADDVSQFVERLSAPPPTEPEPERESRDPSLIGSRFFVKMKRGSQDTETAASSSLGESATSKGEVVIKVTVVEAFLRLLLARDEGNHRSVQPLDAFVSDIDFLLELKPEGKDETVITLSVMDIGLVDRASRNPLPYLTRTSSAGTLATSPPILKLRFISLVVPESTAKESRIKLTLSGFTYNFNPDLQWTIALAHFVKSPPGVFESVVPSERTQASVKVVDGSVRLFAMDHPGAFVVHLGDLEFSTEMIGDSPEMSFSVSAPSIAAFFTDDHPTLSRGHAGINTMTSRGSLHWKKAGYTLLSEVSDLNLLVKRVDGSPPHSEVTVNGVILRVHLCADTGGALGAFFADIGKVFTSEDEPLRTTSVNESRKPATVSTKAGPPSELMASIDQHAFRRIPEVGASADMIFDDLPSNPEYLDESFGAAAGLRDFDDEDLDDFDNQHSNNVNQDLDDPNVISRVGGETIKLLRPQAVPTVENYFNTLPALSEETPQLGEVRDRIRVHNAEVTLFLYEGYDWVSTRKNIEHEVKEMKRRLAKIRQLVADGQAFDPEVEETSTLLYNSIYLGLEQDIDELEPKALIAAIDEELKDEVDTESVSSWQSLPPPASGKPTPPPVRLHGQRLTRAKGPSIEFRLLGLNAEVDQYMPDEEFVSRTFAIVKDIEILDHVKTSTWRKFLTALRSDSRGNVRETGSNMVRVELRTVCPVPGNPSEETRLRAKLLPLRLHVDQDALDFLKKFFSFKDPNAAPASAPQNEVYLQRAEVFPVGLKLDYKPRRVDYRALRDGKTIELMNFFHFDGAEMTLRHITVSGVTGWPRFFDLLNDMWTPDVKATQLADVISGVAPIRSVVNVGSGVADLVLLPIAQYRKDGRVVRGVQKGTKAFVRSTAMEAIKLGARLATGTQVILEQTENVIGSQFNETVFAETMSSFPVDPEDPEGDQQWTTDRLSTDPISKYAEQPMDLTEGMQSAYASLRHNLNSAAQTILAVPMEVYERSGNEGPVRAVIRAVPIAVLKPMIGASEAVSKALLGLHNTLDPDVRYENEAKYKHR